MTNLFKVDGQTLTPIEIYPAVSDTVNYLTFAFMFSYDWAGLTKSAIFTKGTDVYEVVLTDDEVLESDHVNLTAGTWSISVVGDTVVDAVVTRQITTSSYEYTVEQSNATSGGVFPPSVASQIYVNVNQATPQTFVGGIPKLAADRVIDQDNEIADKKYVDDHSAPIPDHNDLTGLQGGSSGEYYHTTQAQNAALHAHSNKTAIDAVSGTNTGDQDIATPISAHNSATDAHPILARKTETMRLLISRTIGAGENVSAITWTQDDAGNALNLLDVEIRFSVPSNGIAVGTSGYLLVKVNDYGGANDYHAGVARAGYMYGCVFRTTYGKSVLSVKRSGGFLCGSMSGYYYDGSSANGPVYVNGTLFSLSSVTKIYVFLLASGLTYIPEGTVIEVYGRTA